VFAFAGFILGHALDVGNALICIEQEAFPVLLREIQVLGDDPGEDRRADAALAGVAIEVRRLGGGPYAYVRPPAEIDMRP
jgi:hypothetical protein